MKRLLSYAAIGFALLNLAACGKWTNKHYSENAYIHANSLPALQLPEHLKLTSELTPLYSIPAGPVAKLGSEAMDLTPPQIIPPDQQRQKAATPKPSNSRPKTAGNGFPVLTRRAS